MVVPHVANNDGCFRGVPFGSRHLGLAVFFLGAEIQLEMGCQNWIRKARHENEDCQEDKRGQSM